MRSSTNAVGCGTIRPGKTVCECSQVRVKIYDVNGYGEQSLRGECDRRDLFPTSPSTPGALPEELVAAGCRAAIGPADNAVFSFVLGTAMS